MPLDEGADVLLKLVSGSMDTAAQLLARKFGARSTGEPASLRDVVCDAAGLIEGLLFPTARPRVMHAVSPRLSRYTRHPRNKEYAP